MSAAFPLILTFSLGEKEQQLHISTFAKRSEPLTRFIGTESAWKHLIIKCLI
jgi:hypothetical protein